MGDNEPVVDRVVSRERDGVRLYCTITRMFKEYSFEKRKSTDQKFKAKTRILGECRVFSIYLRWSHVFALSSGDKVLVAIMAVRHVHVCKGNASDGLS